MQKKAKAWLSLATALALLGGCVFSGSFAVLAAEDTYGDKTVIDAIDSAEGWGDADFLRLETSAAGEAFLLGKDVYKRQPERRIAGVIEGQRQHV